MREMKDSGIEWIGEIPKDWDIIRLKYVYNNANVGESVDKEYCNINGEGIVFYTAGLKPIYTSYNDFPCWKYTKKTDILLARNGTPYVYLPGERAAYSDHIIRIDIKGDYDKRFIRYCLQRAIDSVMVETVSIATWSISLWREQFLSVPTYLQQQHLADYLDQKCYKIDAIIEKQNAIIEKLKEYKLSIITEAVTKGVNPNVKLQESNIEWIASKPTEWKLVKIRKIAMTSSGSTPLRNKEGEYFQNATIPWIRTLDLNDGEVFESSEKITSEALNNSSCRIMPINTVCVAMYGGAGTIGKSGILRIEATTNQAICSMVCRDNMIPEYLLYQMQAIRKYWMKFAVGTRKDPNISQDIVSNMTVLLPPKYEQEKIVNELKKRIKSIEKVICDKGKIVMKLQEYKKSLIYEVVTGKMEV